MIIALAEDIYVDNSLIGLSVRQIDTDDDRLLSVIPCLMLQMILYERAALMEGALQRDQYKVNLSPEHVFAATINIMACIDGDDLESTNRVMLNIANNGENIIKLEQSYLEQPEEFEKFNQKYYEGLLAIIESPLLIPDIEGKYNEPVVNLVLPYIPELKKHSRQYRKYACNGAIHAMEYLLKPLFDDKMPTFMFNNEADMSILLDGRRGYCLMDFNETMMIYLNNFALLKNKSYCKKIFRKMAELSKNNDKIRAVLMLFIIVHRDIFEEVYTKYPEIVEILA